MRRFWRGKRWWEGPRGSAALHKKILSGMSSYEPGFGRDALDSGKKQWPSAWGQYASAEALRFRATGEEEALGNAQAAAQWLMEHADEDGDGVPGYGVPVARRLFKLVDVIPAHTPHAVPTSLAMRGLLDVYELDGDPVWLKLALRCVGGLWDYRNDTWDYSCFHFVRWAGASFEVVNANALVAAQILRLGGWSGDEELTKMAEKAFRHVFTHATGSKDCPKWWYQGDVRPDLLRPKRPNDVMHEMYILGALIDYKLKGGENERAVHASGLWNNVGRFVRKDGVRELPVDFTSVRPSGSEKVSPMERSARLGGLAAAVEVSALLEIFLGPDERTNTLALELEARISNDSWFQYPRHATACLRAVATLRAVRGGIVGAQE